MECNLSEKQVGLHLTRFLVYHLIYCNMSSTCMDVKLLLWLVNCMCQYNGAIPAKYL